MLAGAPDALKMRRMIVLKCSGEEDQMIGRRERAQEGAVGDAYNSMTRRHAKLTSGSQGLWPHTCGQDSHTGFSSSTGQLARCNRGRQHASLFPCAFIYKNASWSWVIEVVLGKLTSEAGLAQNPDVPRLNR